MSGTHCEQCAPDGTPAPKGRRAHVALLLQSGLTLEAERRLRDRTQALCRDLLTARLADAVAAGSDARERILDRAQLVDVAVDLRQVEMDEEVADGPVVEVGHLLDQVRELLILMLLDLAANVFPHLAATLLEARLELLDVDVNAFRHRPAPSSSRPNRSRWICKFHTPGPDRVASVTQPAASTSSIARAMIGSSSTGTTYTLTREPSAEM